MENHMVEKITKKIIAKFKASEPNFDGHIERYFGYFEVNGTNETRFFVKEDEVEPKSGFFKKLDTIIKDVISEENK